MIIKVVECMVLLWWWKGYLYYASTLAKRADYAYPIWVKWINHSPNNIPEYYFLSKKDS